MMLVLSILKPIFLVWALVDLWRSLKYIRGSRLEGVFLSLAVFLVILLAGSIAHVARVPEIFDVNVGQITLSFLVEWMAYVVLLLCGYSIYRNYQRSFVSIWEKIFMALLLAGTLALIFSISNQLIYYFGANSYTVRTTLLIGMGLFLAVILIPTYLNYIRTRFFLAWCLIGGGLVLLTAVNYLQMVVETRSLGLLLVTPTEIIRTATYFCLALGLELYHGAHKRVDLPSHKYVDREAWSERESLEQLFVYIVESLFSLYGSVYGIHNQRGLEKKWNANAAREGEAIRLTDGKLENIRGPVQLLPQAERLQKFLDLTYYLLMHYCGKPFVEKMIGSLCQEIYWAEKELADTHFFSKLPWGARFLSSVEEKEAPLEQLLQGLPIFYHLTPEEIEYLKTRFKRRAYRAGKKMIREGERGDQFYLIASGECEVLKKKGWRPVLLARLRRGDYFGEKALLEATRRTATLKTVTRLVVYALSKDDFLQILKSHFEVLQKMEKFYHTIDFLSPIPLFSNFSLLQLQYMASQMQRRHFTAGEWVVRQGEPAEEFFVIEEGEAEVLAEGPGGEARKIATLGKGEYFGEISLIQKGGRIASVKALTDLDCLELKKEDFDRLFTGCDYNRHRLERLILRRKEDLEKKLSSTKPR